MMRRIKELRLNDSSGAQFYLIHTHQILSEELDKFKEVLNEDDLQKAQKYLSQKDTDQCLMIYTLVKKILSMFLGKKPQDLAFLRNPFGKPYLEGHPLHFNFSHSGIYAFLGIHPTHPIGVDIESNNRRIPLEGFLYPKEIASLSLPPVLLWAAKEACVKALGIGFSQSLPHLELLYEAKSNGVFYFITHLSESFPTLLVKGYNKIITSYKLATCVNE